MAVNSARENGTLIARTDGRIDGANAREFQVALEDAIDPSDSTVILDMENLSYISSAGLRVILMTAKTLQKQNAKFAICSLSPAIREVFQISGFDRIIPIHSSQEEAISSFKGS
jgi:anti-sigma B factor antagonist